VKLSAENFNYFENLFRKTYWNGCVKGKCFFGCAFYRKYDRSSISGSKNMGNCVILQDITWQMAPGNSMRSGRTMKSGYSRKFKIQDLTLPPDRLLAAALCRPRSVKEPDFGFDQGQKYGQGMTHTKQHEPAILGEPK
jgi:hypothetical protein